MGLSWPIRVKVVLGAAKGLAFLHEAEQPVIYRDFKTSNILLDSVSIFYTKSLLTPSVCVCTSISIYLYLYIYILIDKYINI